jgi:hypothetical protein
MKVFGFVAELPVSDDYDQNLPTDARLPGECALAEGEHKNLGESCAMRHGQQEIR